MDILSPLLGQLARRAGSALRHPMLAPLVNEHVVDFYARHLHPQLSLRQVIAKVLGREAASADAVTLRLAPNYLWRGFRAGQHVTLTVEIDGVRHHRVYSLSAAAADDVQITVKRQPGGLVSNYLLDQVNDGDYLQISPAFGDFVLPQPVPQKLLLIGAGSGMTPLLALAEALLQTPDYTGQVMLLNYGRSHEETLFHQRLLRLRTLHPNLRVVYGLTAEGVSEGELSGRFCARHLDELLADAAEWQVMACGPQGLVDGVKALWAERAYPLAPLTESFTPLAVPQATSEQQPVALNFRLAGRAVTGNNQQPLLQQAEAAGLQPASGCRMGICFSCTCRKTSGTVKNLLTGQTSSEPDEDIRLCVSVPLSDVSITL